MKVLKRDPSKPKKINPIFILVSAFTNYRKNGIPKLSTSEGVEVLRNQLQHNKEGFYSITMEFSQDNRWHPYLIYYRFSDDGFISIEGFFSEDKEYILKSGSDFGMTDDFVVFKRSKITDIYMHIPVDVNNISRYVRDREKRGFAKAE